MTAWPSDGFLPLQQSEVYAVALRACGARVRWLESGGTPVLAVERGGLRLISRGPVPEVADDPVEPRRRLRRLARWAGITVMTPESGVRGPGLIPLVTPVHHAILPLNGDLAAGMAATWRSHLRARQAVGRQVRPGSLATLEALIAAEGRQRRARRYHALPESFTRALPLDALRLWEWQRGGVPEAAMAFVRHGATATYHLAWGSDAARAAGVHPVMLTRAAEALVAEGVRWLDLGSVDSEAAPGLARFKLGTGARLHRLGATMLVLP
jgi:hypothetical protein